MVLFQTWEERNLGVVKISRFWKVLRCIQSHQRHFFLLTFYLHETSVLAHRKCNFNFRKGGSISVTQLKSGGTGPNVIGFIGQKTGPSHANQINTEMQDGSVLYVFLSAAVQDPSSHHTAIGNSENLCCAKYVARECIFMRQIWVFMFLMILLITMILQFVFCHPTVPFYLWNCRGGARSTAWERTQVVSSIFTSNKISIPLSSFREIHFISQPPPWPLPYQTHSLAM